MLYKHASIFYKRPFLMFHTVCHAATYNDGSTSQLNHIIQKDMYGCSHKTILLFKVSWNGGGRLSQILHIYKVASGNGFMAVLYYYL